MIISKEIQFDAGHRVPQHKSKCRSQHGHRYRLVVYVEGPVVQSDDSDDGMVIDFGDLKIVMMDKVHDLFDHANILWVNDPLTDILTERWSELKVKQLIVTKYDVRNDSYDFCKFSTNEMGNVVIVGVTPTAENLTYIVWNILNMALKETFLKLSRIELWETPTSCAILEKERDGV